MVRMQRHARAWLLFTSCAMSLALLTTGSFRPANLTNPNLNANPTPQPTRPVSILTSSLGPAPYRFWSSSCPWRLFFHLAPTLIVCVLTMAWIELFPSHSMMVSASPMSRSWRPGLILPLTLTHTQVGYLFMACLNVTLNVVFLLAWGLNAQVLQDDTHQYIVGRCAALVCVCITPLTHWALFWAA